MQLKLNIGYCTLKMPPLNMKLDNNEMQPLNMKLDNNEDFFQLEDIYSLLSEMYYVIGYQRFEEYFPRKILDKDDKDDDYIRYSELLGDLGCGYQNALYLKKILFYEIKDYLDSYKTNTDKIVLTGDKQIAFYRSFSSLIKQEKDLFPAYALMSHDKEELLQRISLAYNRLTSKYNALIFDIFTEDKEEWSKRLENLRVKKPYIWVRLTNAITNYNYQKALGESSSNDILSQIVGILKNTFFDNFLKKTWLLVLTTIYLPVCHTYHLMVPTPPINSNNSYDNLKQLLDTIYTPDFDSELTDYFQKFNLVSTSAETLYCCKLVDSHNLSFATIPKDMFFLNPLIKQVVDVLSLYYEDGDNRKKTRKTPLHTRCFAIMSVSGEKYATISGFNSALTQHFKHHLTAANYKVIDAPGDTRYYLSGSHYITLGEVKALNLSKYNDAMRGLFSCCERKLLTVLYPMTQGYDSIIYVKYAPCYKCKDAIVQLAAGFTNAQTLKVKHPPKLSRSDRRVCTDKKVQKLKRKKDYNVALKLYHEIQKHQIHVN